MMYMSFSPVSFAMHMGAGREKGGQKKLIILKRGHWGSSWLILLACVVINKYLRRKEEKGLWIQWVIGIGHRHISMVILCLTMGLTENSHSSSIQFWTKDSLLRLQSLLNFQLDVDSYLLPLFLKLFSALMTSAEQRWNMVWRHRIRSKAESRLSDTMSCC